MLDVVDLRNFYAQPLGTVARRFVGRGIRARWADTRAQRVVGVGYATPYLGLFREEADTRELIKLKAVYEHLESISDRCEDVANLVEGIVLENS